MLVNILFVIIIILLICMAIYIYKRESYITDIHRLVGYYGLRFGVYSPEQIATWIANCTTFDKDGYLIKK